jgi:dGTPase
MHSDARFLRRSRQVREAEEERLSPAATRSTASRGRARPEEPDDFPTAFERDRDRVIHAKAFRRLKHKTQVFLNPDGDHYVTRLTHTLEVAQIARTIARALALNEDLTEAICLGHDLGHTPFGHLGEEVVAAFHPSFKHNLQSVRIVEVLEDLNLTFEVRDGIANHTWSMPTMPATLEGQIARYADRIAYINHDIDDAIRARILSETDLPSETTEVLGATHAKRITKMVGDLVNVSAGADEIAMSDDVFEAMATTRKFLFEEVYLGRVGAATSAAVDEILSTLLAHHAGGGKEEVVAAVDYVAGMTDRFALRAYEELTSRPAPSLSVEVLG